MPRRETRQIADDPTHFVFAPTMLQDYGNLSETEAKRLVMATQVNVLKMESQLERYVSSGRCPVRLVVGRDQTVSTPQSLLGRSLLTVHILYYFCAGNTRSFGASVVWSTTLKR